MTFRANEAEESGYARAVQYLVPRDVGNDERARSRQAVADLVDRCGPVIDHYPLWHPLVSAHDPRDTVTTPSERCGYKGLDHTIYFRNGFVTCPYDDGRSVLESVADLDSDGIALISAEVLNATLYRPGTTPILVRCEWQKPLLLDGTVPKSIAVPLILEREVPCWRWSQVAETWETMRPYFLGSPHGNRSSLFINQDTATAIKKVWLALIETGAFGPIKV